MTRTYLKSSSQLTKPPENEKKRACQTTKDWRSKPLFDESPDSPQIEFKAKKSRKPLQPLNNPSIFSDSSNLPSSPDISFKRNVLPNTTNPADDTFDKLFDNVKKKVDPFDQLFENVHKMTTDPFDQLLSNTSPLPRPLASQGLYSSVFSTPNESDVFLTDTSHEPGLFSSFSKPEKGQKSPKLKRLKSNRNVRNKKHSVRDVKKPREDILSETLEVKIIFEGDIQEGHSFIPNQVSSLTLLSPTATRGRGLSALSVATSTPVLASKSSWTALSSESSPAPSNKMTLSPVQDIHLEDDVFLRRQSTKSTSSQPSPPTSRLDPKTSDEFYDATPQKSFVNRSRGNPKFGGPAASLMNHIGWKFSMATIPIQSNASSTSMLDSPGMQSTMEEEEVTVNLDCVCGINQMTSSHVIQCDQCGVWYHTDCMQLGMTCIEELEREDLDWVCTFCIDEAVINPDMTKNFIPFTPGRLELESHSKYCCDDANGDTESSHKDTEPHISYISTSQHSVECSVVSPSPTPATHNNIASSLTAASSLQALVSPLTTTNRHPEQPSVTLSPEKRPSPPSSPTTSLLSLTAQLEEHHLATTDTMQDASLMFIKPVAPPIRSQVKEAPPVDEVQLRPGKSWRRSLCQAKRTVSLAASFAQPRLASLAEDGICLMVASKLSLGRDNAVSSTPDTSKLTSSASVRRPSRLDPVPLVELLGVSPNKAAAPPIGPNLSSPLSTEQQIPRLDPLESVDFIPPTPQKIPTNPLHPSLSLARSISRSSRTSFCVVPATPRPDRLGGGRLSVMQLLSETLQTDKNQLLSQTLLSNTLEPDSPQIVELTAVEKLLAACTKEEILPFDAIYPADKLEGSKKVGEGAFGEVFLLGSEGEDRPVLKVVPIDGDIPVNGEDQTTVEAMFSEVIISSSLSKLRMGFSNLTAGFVEVRGCHVFQGEYPPQLLQLWDEYNEEHKSENDRPDNLPVDQKFIALEFNNGGKDLEKFVFRDATQALHAWKQVAHTLAVAEEGLKFEHRDLHWGNVLVKETTQKTVDFTLGGDTYQVETGGVLTTIIDFSLSRLAMDNVIIFNNLSEDPTLFTARGKDQPGGDYQFDIYKKMKEFNGNNWEPFQPRSNIMWLDYMLDKMATEVYYKAKKSSKNNKSGQGKIRALRKTLYGFECAADWVKREGNRVD